MTNLDYSASDEFRLMLCGLILISRLGDILSTYFVTPTLKLEANPLARKFGWRFIVFTMIVAIIPFFSAAAGIIVLVPSLLVSASNISKIFAVRTLGEAEYHAFLLKVVSRGKLSHAIVGVLVSNVFFALAGAFLLFLGPDPHRFWSFWFAIGMLVYSVAISMHSCLYYKRLFKSAHTNRIESDTA